MMIKRILCILALICFALPATCFAIESGDIVGTWSIDDAKSKEAADGNTAGVMKKISINEDGTFEALYGTTGTWKLKDGQLLVTYTRKAGFRKDEPAVMDGNHLKFPAPAYKDKFCYLSK